MHTKKIYSKNAKYSGATLVEVLLAVALLGMLTVGLVASIIYVVQSASDSFDSIQATQVAQEGLEAINDIRNQDFALLTDGNKGLALSANRWTFSGASDTTTPGFTRTVNITTADSNPVTGAVTKKIISTVTWGNPTKSIIVNTYLTNWLRETTTIGDWTIPSNQSTLDITTNSDGLDVHVVGNIAFVTRALVTTTSQFCAVNITTNTSINCLVTAITGTLNNFAIRGNYAYITTTNNTGEIAIVDISNPSDNVNSFKVVSLIDIPGTNDATGIKIYGDRMYVARTYVAGASSPELVGLNLTNATAPTIVSSYDSTNTSGYVDLEKIGNYIYLSSANTGSELNIFPISGDTLSAPTAINLSGSQAGSTVANYNGLLFFARLNTSNIIFNTTVTPLNPTQVKSFNPQAAVGAVDFTDDWKYALMATDRGTGEFQVWDVSLANPTRVGQINETAALYGLEYVSTLDRAIVVGASNTEELIIVRPG
jgi:Tfp pilus assembly protein PilV